MFAFRLAERLGMTVCQLLHSMPSSELTEWRAYYIIQSEKPVDGKPKKLSEDDIKSMFGGRVVKKGS